MPTWDERIDEAARKLTEGEPGAGFTTRVAARIDDRRRGWSPMWLLVPAAVAAIVVLAIVMPREELNRAQSTTERPSAADVRVTLDATEVRPTPGGTEVWPSPSATELRPKSDATKVRPKPDTPFEAAMDDQTDLAVASIELAPVVVDALREAPPLEIDELAISPMTALDQ